MYKTKRRRKASRYRGSHTHCRGFKKKARGSGHQGGKGMSGTGKRGDQKKTIVLNLYGNDYFGKDKTLRRGNVAPKLKVINLYQIQENLSSFQKQKDSIIDLKGYKVLGDGEINMKINITASAFSSSAKEKIEKAGGKIMLSSTELKK